MGAGRARGAAERRGQAARVGGGRASRASRSPHAAPGEGAGVEAPEATRRARDQSLAGRASRRAPSARVRRWLERSLRTTWCASPGVAETGSSRAACKGSNRASVLPPASNAATTQGAPASTASASSAAVTVEATDRRAGGVWLRGSAVTGERLYRRGRRDPGGGRSKGHRDIPRGRTAATASSFTRCTVFVWMPSRHVWGRLRSRAPRRRHRRAVTPGSGLRRPRGTDRGRLSPDVRREAWEGWAGRGRARRAGCG